MKAKVESQFSKYFHGNASIFFLLLLAFVIGITAGAFTIAAMDNLQKNELHTYLNGFFDAKRLNVSSFELFKQIFLNYLKIVILLWFLGATVLGIPIIFGLIGFQGFTIGFTVGFLFDVFSDFRGILVVASSIIPQVLIVLPCLLILSISGVKFSLYLLKGGSQKKLTKNEIKMKLLSHSAISVIVLLVIAIGAFLQAILMPMIFKIMS